MSVSVLVCVCVCVCSVSLSHQNNRGQFRTHDTLLLTVTSMFVDAKTTWVVECLPADVSLRDAAPSLPFKRMCAHTD